MALDDGTLLGEKLVIVQPLARPNSKLADSAECVRTWTGGLIVRDADSVFTPTWREAWAKSLRTGRFVTTQFVDDLGALRRYLLGELKDKDGKVLESPTRTPEALVILAHHGPGGISDRGSDSAGIAREWLRSFEVKRQFDSRSFAVLALCSVGAVGHGDDNPDVLDYLNAANVRAAIVNPFQVPLGLAKSFLDHFQKRVLAPGAPADLHTLFKDAKNSFRTSTAPGEDSPGLKAAIDTFMLLGDGGVKVCKP